eukprot:NODE_1957_length_688_cov_27.754011_g1907_i0.p1 GENE.NODE_1957_length_688_cov_27.754011_g1907_i0~~NODE_1957_length_688_cov_27.754011_g1907_i0.p1  ORF type:complete len:139 (+),score=37.22 NODE_1957_length_688_cov_27.754011_g1907_i0:83-499(+)
MFAPTAVSPQPYFGTSLPNTTAGQFTGTFVPGPTTAAPTVVAPTGPTPQLLSKATVQAELNPLRGFDQAQTGTTVAASGTRMARIPTPVDVATDPGSNTLANRLFDPWYAARGSRPDFTGLPYEWAGYWKGNSILRGW